MKTMKMMSIVLGSTLFLGGCIGGLLETMVTAVPASILTELVMDNDAIFDLFAD